MGFRDRMKKRKKGSTLQKRHNQGTKQTGGTFPTIFNKDEVPEGVEFWRCGEGDHHVDIIPFEAGPDMPFDNDHIGPITEEGDLDYVLDLFVHMNVGNMNKPYVCPFENFGKECPICEFIKANRLEKEDWKKLAPKHRVVYLLWVHDDRKEEKKGVQIFEASHFFMEEKIAEIAKLPRGGGYINFSDPDKGRSLMWKRKGTGQQNTQYLGHRFIERESKIPDKILDQTFPLDSIINMHPSYDEIEKDFRGTLKKMKLSDDDDFREEDEDHPDIPFDDDDEPIREKKKKKKSDKIKKSSKSVKKKKKSRR